MYCQIHVDNYALLASQFVHDEQQKAYGVEQVSALQKLKQLSFLFLCLIEVRLYQHDLF